MVEAPMVRITGQRRHGRGTIRRSGAHRDYRMSTYVFPCARSMHRRLNQVRTAWPDERLSMLVVSCLMTSTTYGGLVFVGHGGLL